MGSTDGPRLVETGVQGALCTLPGISLFHTCAKKATDIAVHIKKEGGQSEAQESNKKRAHCTA